MRMVLWFTRQWSILPRRRSHCPLRSLAIMKLNSYWVLGFSQVGFGYKASMKKLLFMLLAAFLLPVAVKAQNIAYSYDAAGNRILRALANNSYQSPRKSVTDDNLSKRTFPSISVSPNPTNGLLNICLSRWDNDYTCHLLLSDLSGLTLIEQDMNSPEASLNLSSFPAGYYLLLVDINGQQQSYKIIKN